MLIFILAVALVALAHRYLQLLAPSNAVIAWARANSARWRTVAVLVSLAIAALAAVRLLEAVLAAGAPGWLNFVTLILAWDATKFGLAAVFMSIQRGRTVLSGGSATDLGASDECRGHEGYRR